jgi:phospholipid/cholesterol/gamma-HCH transport system substrate-binding protein
VKRAIKKNARVFTAIILLVAGALAIGGYILSNQRLYLPGWVPVIGTGFYEVDAELTTAQAVVPGQGQTVNIAGVPVGEVGEVTLEGGRAVVRMKIRDEHAPIYRDATILLRPKTALKDMYLSLDPGTRAAGEVPEGGTVRVANTLPDVNSDQVLAQLDADTRAYLQILLNSGGTAFDDQRAQDEQLESSGAPGSEDVSREQSAAQDLRETFKRFEPTARYGRRFTRLLSERRRNLRRVIHNFQRISTALAEKDRQLAAFVDSSNANFEAFAQEEANLREAFRLFPGALSQTATTLRKTATLAGELGPTLEGLRPFARDLAPALRRTQPFLRETTPIIREQIRPFARDVQPVVRDLRDATSDLAVVSPKLTDTFRVLNKIFNLLAFEPSGAGNSGLFWASWAAHHGVTAFSSQDAHGPIRRGLILTPCTNYNPLEEIVKTFPQLGLLTRLTNFPPEAQACPENLILGPDDAPP